MRRILCVVFSVGLVALAACSPGGENVVSSDESTATTALNTTTTAASGRPGLWTDEPCTRPIQIDDLPAQVPFQAEDLERMVLTRDDVGGLSGFDSDIGRHGYQGNGELQTVEVNPPSTCEDLERYGRITGYGTAYLTWDGPRVLFSVHLFWDEAGAHGWIQAFLDGIVATVGTADGPDRFDVGPLPELGDDAVLVEHDGAEGTRSWVIFRRGPIVGWVVDLHQGTRSAIDVVAAARQMTERVEEVTAQAAGRPRHGLDAAHLLSAPLTLAAFGDRYQNLEWNYFFGGCSDTEERGAVAGEEEADDARRFGRVVGCAAMYEPPTDTGHDVVRIYTSVTVYRDAAGAAADFADAVAEIEAGGGERFETPELGDETVGLVDASTALTRVTFRVDDIVAAVQVHEETLRATPEEVAELARTLRDRIATLIAHSGS